MYKIVQKLTSMADQGINDLESVEVCGKENDNTNRLIQQELSEGLYLLGALVLLFHPIPNFPELLVPGMDVGANIEKTAEEESL